MTIVRQRLEAHLLRLRTRLDWAAADDIVHKRPIAATEQFLHLLSNWTQDPSHLSLTQPADAFACPDCQASFQSRTLLAQHRMQDHRVLLMHPIGFGHARDAHKGLPTCAHCLRDFRDWSHLRLHIASRACLAFAASKDINDDIVRAQLQLRFHLMAETWDDIPKMEGLRAFLSIPGASCAKGSCLGHRN